MVSARASCIGGVAVGTREIGRSGASLSPRFGDSSGKWMVSPRFGRIPKTQRQRARGGKDRGPACEILVTRRRQADGVVLLPRELSPTSLPWRAGLNEAYCPLD